MSKNNIADNIESINAEIAKTAKEHERNADDVQLIAVSKKQPDERIQAAIDAGHRLFGENRVQEAQEHWNQRRDQYDDLELHLIGPLQTNKVKDALSLFDCIQTLDRPKLADKIKSEITKQPRDISFFIQVNTGEEAQKAGVLPADLDVFYDYCVRECGLKVRGLMCIPPVNEPAGLHFAFLKKLADGLGLTELSMGMSSDYEKAVAAGATHIRVGTGVFGIRPGYEA